MPRRDFGRYKVVEEIGRGAMGIVYRASDPVIGRIVAIKAVNESFVEAAGVPSDEYFKRFRREAEVAGGLDHPHIVKVFDLGPDYIVMEFIAGHSLADALKTRVRFTLSRVLTIVSEVASALDHAHAHGVVHRDIKPANIMLALDGAVKVMDFGLARIESSTLTAAGEVLGSASYMAPEVVLGRKADARSDLFSLGVVAYELMTEQRPFAGSSVSAIIHRIVQDRPRPAHEVNLEVPPDYDAIFTRVFAKDPAQRYDTASEFASDLLLNKWADRDPVLTGSEEPPAPAPETPLPVADPAAGTVVVGAPPALDRGEATTMLVEADEAVVELEEVPAGEDPGQATTMMIETAEELAAVGDAAAASEQGEEDAPLASLLAEPPVASQGPGSAIQPAAKAESPTRTYPPGSRLQEIAQDAAARPAPATSAEVPPTEAPPETQPEEQPAATPQQGGLPKALMAALAAGVVLFLAGGGGAAYLAWHYLRPHPVDVSPIPSPDGAQTPVPAPTPEPTPAPDVTPEPEQPSRTAAPEGVPLAIGSEPAGARVSVGGKPAGKTPLQLELQPGRVSVSVEKEGFRPWKRDLSVEPGKPQRLQAKLEPAPPPPVAAPATPKPAVATAGVRAGDLVALGPDVTRPRKLSGDPPKAPKGANGSVLLELLVDETGAVSDVKVIDSGGAALDQACVAAVRTWRYAPAETQGVKVKVRLPAKFSFQAR